MSDDTPKEGYGLRQVEVTRSVEELEAKIDAVLALPEREWLASEADSPEARAARAYNSALGSVKTILRKGNS